MIRTVDAATDPDAKRRDATWVGTSMAPRLARCQTGVSQTGPELNVTAGPQQPRRQPIRPPLNALPTWRLSSDLGSTYSVRTQVVIATLRRVLGGCHPAEGLSRPAVEVGGDGVEVGFGEGA